MRVFRFLLVLAAAGLCAALAEGPVRGASGKMPRDKAVHPVLKLTSAHVIPDSRKDPVYPERWRERHLGAKVILQVTVTRSGSVSDVTPVMTKLREEGDCSGSSGGQPAVSGSGDSETASVIPVISPEAARDFEAAAVRAVKQWKFKPPARSGVPVGVIETQIIEFTTCPGKPDNKPPAKP